MTAIFEKADNGTWDLVGFPFNVGEGDDVPRINRSGVTDVNVERALALDLATDDDDVVEEDEREYEDWSFKELKEQCGVRGLSKSGNKDDLVLRLLEDDENEEEEAEEPNESNKD